MLSCCLSYPWLLCFSSPRLWGVNVSSTLWGVGVPQVQTLDLCLLLSTLAPLVISSCLMALNAIYVMTTLRFYLQPGHLPWPVGARQLPTRMSTRPLPLNFFNTDTLKFLLPATKDPVITEVFLLLGLKLWCHPWLLFFLHFNFNPSENTFGYTFKIL